MTWAEFRGRLTYFGCELSMLSTGITIMRLWTLQNKVFNLADHTQRVRSLDSRFPGPSCRRSQEKT